MSESISIGNLVLHSTRERAAIFRDALLFCPKLQDLGHGKADAAEVYVGTVPFYEAYKLVSVRWETLQLLGFWRPGDFWPLDDAGRTITRLNQLAPLRLTSADAQLSYALLRLACEHWKGIGKLLYQQDAPIPAFLCGTGDAAQFDLKESGAAAHFLRAPTLTGTKMDVQGSREAGNLIGRYSVRATLAYLGADLKLVRVLISGDSEGEVYAVRGADVNLKRPSGTTPVLHVERRYEPALGAPRWAPAELRGAESPHDNDLARAVIAQWGMVRLADFDPDEDFYRGKVDLIEVFARPDASAVQDVEVIGDDRKYFVRVKDGAEPGAPTAATLVELTGTSAMVDALNEQVGVLLDTPRRRASYIRFYGWAVRGENGAFLVPRNEAEVMRAARERGVAQEDVAKALTDEHRARLKPDPVEMAAGEATSIQKHLLWYGAHLYAASFTLSWANQNAPNLRITDDAQLLGSQGEVRGSIPEPEEFQFPGCDDLGPFGAQSHNAGGAGTPPGEGAVFTETVDVSTIHGKREVRFRNCHFKGGVTASGRRVEVPLHFEQCTFSGERALDLGSAECLGSVTLAACVVDGSIYAGKAHVHGSFVVSGCTVGPVEAIRELEAIRDRPSSAIRPAAVGLSLQDIMLVKKSPVREGGQLSEQFPGASATDATDTSPVRDRLGQTAIDLRAAVIEGDCRVVALRGAATLLGGHWQLAGLSVSGDFAVDQALCWGEVNAAHASFGRSVRVGERGSGARFRAGGDVDLSSISAQADVQVVQCKFDGNVVLNRARIGGLLELNAIEAASASLDFSSIGGTLVVHGDLTATGDAVISLSANSAVVKGDVALSGTAHEVSLRLVDIGGSLTFAGARITRNLVLTFATVRNMVSTERADLHGTALAVGGDIELSGASLGYFDVHGIEVTGALTAIGSKFERFSIQHRLGKTAEGCWWKPATLGALALSNCRVRQGIRLDGLVVPRPTTVEGYLKLLQDGSYGCVISNCEVGSEIRFTRDEPHRAVESNWNRRSSDTGSALWRWFTTASRPLKPTFPTVEDHVVAVWGGVDIRRTEVGRGGIDLRNLQVSGPILLDDTVSHGDVRADAILKVFDATLPMCQTTCTEFRADGMRCEGDLNLSGLRTERGASLRGARVIGDIMFVPLEGNRAQLNEELGIFGHESESQMPTRAERAGAPEFRCMASMEACDLTAASANRVTLSGSNFRDEPTERASVRNVRVSAHAHGVVDESELTVAMPEHSALLELGVFNRIEVVKPTPKTLNLSQVKVGAWEFGDRSDTDSAKEHIEILHQMEPFDRGVWAEVEEHLRIEGKDKAADAVYREMRTAMARSRRKRQADNAARATRAPLRLRLRFGLRKRRAIALAWLLLVGGTAALWSGMWERFVEEAHGRPWADAARLTILWLVCATLLAPSRDLWWDRIHSFATGYGTRWYRPLAVWLAACAISLGVFSDPENVRATTGTLQVTGRLPLDSATGLGPGVIGTLERRASSLSEHWPVSERLWLAVALTVRYQVPMIHTETHDRWEASERGVLGVMTAETWAFLAALISWLTVPLTLLALAAKAVRGVKH